MTIELFPDICDDSQPHEVHQVRLTVVENSFKEKEQDNGNGQQEEQPCVLLEKDIIQGRWTR